MTLFYVTDSFGFDGNHPECLTFFKQILGGMGFQGVDFTLIGDARYIRDARSLSFLTNIVGKIIYTER